MVISKNSKDIKILGSKNFFVQLFIKEIKLAESAHKQRDLKSLKFQVVKDHFCINRFNFFLAFKTSNPLY